MIANLYLHPDTFVYNNIDTEEQVASKLQSLVGDMTEIICCYKDDNRFKVPSKFLSTLVFSNTDIVVFAQNHLDNDKIGIFYSMLYDTSDKYDDISLEELHSLCVYNKDEKIVNSLVVLNVPKYALSDEENATNEEDAKKVHKSILNDYITFEEYRVVYNTSTWMHLRRQILGNHPEAHDYFIKECKKYFPRLIFHNNCISSLSDDDYDYLKTSSRKIIYYLSCLNDKFIEFYNSYREKGIDANILLADFSGRYGLDGAGSLEQNPSKKDIFRFNFECGDGSSSTILCEPHLKITQQDERYGSVDYKTFHPRIYFNFPDMKFEGGRIPIGSIGRHL